VSLEHCCGPCSHAEKSEFELRYMFGLNTYTSVLDDQRDLLLFRELECVLDVLGRLNVNLRALVISHGSNAKRCRLLT
jgi:hypothetical protein